MPAYKPFVGELEIAPVVKCLAGLAIYCTLPLLAADEEVSFPRCVTFFIFSLSPLFIIAPPPRARVLNEIRTGFHSHLCGPGGQLGGKGRRIISRGVAASDRWPTVARDSS